MALKSAKDKYTDLVKELRKLDINKNCANCSERVCFDCVRLWLCASHNSNALLYVVDLSRRPPMSSWASIFSCV